MYIFLKRYEPGNISQLRIYFMVQFDRLVYNRKQQLLTFIVSQHLDYKRIKPQQK